jgi:alpha-L-rhamnosidase
MECPALVGPARLRCEYREDPVGIDGRHPCLGWMLQSRERGQVQTAYRVLVASTRANLARDQGDLWDSGRVASSETANIPYRGETLSPGQACWWKVRIWDQQGLASAWSVVATWTMGLLSATDNDARWIGPPACLSAMEDNPERRELSPKEWEQRKASMAVPVEKHGPLPLLRREFETSKPVHRALVSICGLGCYELHLNGSKVGDNVLDPGWSNYHKTCFYTTYDVTNQIHRGANCISAMLGNGMYHERGERYWKFIGSFGSPQMILRLQVEFKDGTIMRLVSDVDWRVAPGPITFSSIYGGEDYDARLEQPGWDLPGFDDSRWQAAAIIGGPGGRLAAQSAPPIQVMEVLSASGVTEPAPGVYLYDLGQNISGWPSITVRGLCGAKVRIIPAEVLDAKGLADQAGSGHPVSFSYILKGEGNETWHPQFTYYGFRYLQVDCAVPENQATGDTPTLLGIEGHFTRCSAGRAGSFACSHDLLNRIYRLVDWAIGSNLQSIVTDCPHREKLGWIEIASLMAESIMYNYDVVSLYGKIARDMTESQQSSGMVPAIAPEYVVFSEGFRDSPLAAPVAIPWLLYQWYGNRGVLADCYPTMKRYVEYLTSKARDHIVSFGLGDWGDFPSVEEHVGWTQLTPISLTSTAIYYNDAVILARAARILENSDEARRYAALAVEIRNAFNRAFFNPRTQQYVCGNRIVANEIQNEFNQALFDRQANQYTASSQTSLSMPLALGLVEPGYIESVLENLVSEVRKHDYTTVGDLGHPFLLRALSEHGRSDVIFDLHTQTTGPGYGWQIERGGTSLAEARDGRHCASMNHCTFGNILQWFHGHVLGIQNDQGAAGFQRIVIRPQIVGNLRWARGTYDSIRGPIAVDWCLGDGQMTLRVEIPANTFATIHVPTTEAAEVLEGGKPAGEAAGVIPFGVGDRAALYKVGSGSYAFVAPWK